MWQSRKRYEKMIKYSFERCPICDSDLIPRCVEELVVVAISEEWEKVGKLNDEHFFLCNQNKLKAKLACSKCTFIKRMFRGDNI